MQELLEKGERAGVVEDDRSDAAPVGDAVVAEDPLAEALDERRFHRRVGAQEVMDDLVARNGRRAVARETPAASRSSPPRSHP